MAIEEAQDFKKLPFNDLLEKIFTQELTMNEDDELPYKVKNVFKSKKGEVFPHPQMKIVILKIMTLCTWSIPDLEDKEKH